MGNQTSQLPATGKVILLDGSIQEFDQPITVAELMLEYPQQVVVELKQGGQSKPVPLPADKAVELDKLYLMVPLRRGKPAQLSPKEAHNILLRANEVLRSKTLVSSSSKSLPFFARICPATSHDACSSIAVLPKSMKEVTVVSKEIPMEVYNNNNNNNNEVDEGLPEDHGIDERPDYLSRQLSSRGWKPKLDTIEEKKDEMMMMKKKGPKVVLLAAKAVKRIEFKGLVWG